MNKFLLLLSFSFLALSAQMITVKSEISLLDKYKFETPDSRPMKIPHKTKLVIIAFDKETGATVNDYLNTKGKYYLQKNQAIYIADIHKMPGIITRMFALPKMKKYKHLIYLHYDKNFQNFIPNKDNRITILRVENRKVVSIDYITSDKELQAAIEK